MSPSNLERFKPAFEAVGAPAPPQPPQFLPVHNYMRRRVAMNVRSATRRRVLATEPLFVIGMPIVP